MKKKQPKWKPIKMGERLPCQSFLRKKDGEILKLSTGAGIKVGQDAYYLPVDDVIEEIKNYPIEESEDEKIRKELLTFFRESIHGGHILTNKEYDSWIAWLEKQGDKDKLIKELGEYKVKYTQEVLQGEQKSNPCENCSIATNNCQNFPCTIRDCEQKPVDKVEPKFKVGDIITNGILIGEIDEIHEWGYHAYFGDHYADVPDVENWHKWTIQDAKANAGYEGNADKKELKKIEQKPVPKFKVGDIVKHKDNPYLTYILKRFTDDGDYEFHAIGKDGNEGCTCFSVVKYQDEWELVEQKPAWSEEDDIRLNATVSFLERYKGIDYENTGVCISWLKSLKPQSTWKPSEKQLNALHWCVMNVGSTERQVLQELLEQLEKLKN